LSLPLALFVTALIGFIPLAHATLLAALTTTLATSGHLLARLATLMFLFALLALVLFAIVWHASIPLVYLIMKFEVRKLAANLSNGSSICVPLMQSSTT